MAGQMGALSLTQRASEGMIQSENDGHPLQFPLQRLSTFCRESSLSY
jgi:hypothetical protein